MRQERHAVSDVILPKKNEKIHPRALYLSGDSDRCQSIRFMGISSGNNRRRGVTYSPIPDKFPWDTRSVYTENGEEGGIKK